MTSVTRLIPAAATFDSTRRHAAATPPRAASAPAAGSTAPVAEPVFSAAAADVFAAQLQRAMPGGLARQVEPSLDAPRARAGALAAQDRLAAQLMSIANVQGGRLVSLLGD